MITRDCLLACQRLLAGIAGLICAWAQAETAQVAVAANFAVPMQKIAAAFERDTGHKALLSFGATGKFYAQVRNGAPFAVLLAADDETPARLVKDGLAVPGSAFTYAMGQLVLWSSDRTLVDSQGAVLNASLNGKLALADPKLAPYGAAAQEVMRQLGVWPLWQNKLVQGESIGQAFQFVNTENVPLGFVALSQIWLDGRVSEGSAWVVPANLHPPLQHDAVLLRPGQDNPAALALLRYLQSDTAKAIIRRHGYAL